jgi:ADP-heptose:LPS heptosyltransferase
LNLPGATFAFFDGDPFQLEFQSLGLQTQSFKSVEDILRLISGARRTLATDSFPSHVAQSYTASATVMLTEQLPPRTIYPAFAGSVVRTTAPCAPCKHVARGLSHCEAGHAFCVTWSDRAYTETLLATVS